MANPYRPWRSGRLANGQVDEHPTVEITLAALTRIDRVAVASGSIVCCETGLLDYTISARTTAGEWVVVATQADQFWERIALFGFAPIEATALRLEVPWTTIRGVRMLSVNYTGHSGGLPPTYMGVQTESDAVVSINTISAWAAQP